MFPSVACTTTEGINCTRLTRRVESKLLQTMRKVTLIHRYTIISRKVALCQISWRDARTFVNELARVTAARTSITQLPLYITIDCAYELLQLLHHLRSKNLMRSAIYITIWMTMIFSHRMINQRTIVQGSNRTTALCKVEHVCGARGMSTR